MLSLRRHHKSSKIPGVPEAVGLAPLQEFVLGLSSLLRPVGSISSTLTRKA